MLSGPLHGKTGLLRPLCSSSAIRSVRFIKDSQLGTGGSWRG